MVTCNRNYGTRLEFATGIQTMFRANFGWRLRAVARLPACVHSRSVHSSQLSGTIPQVTSNAVPFIFNVTSGGMPNSLSGRLFLFLFLFAPLTFVVGACFVRSFVLFWFVLVTRVPLAALWRCQQGSTPSTRERLPVKM